MVQPICEDNRQWRLPPHIGWDWASLSTSLHCGPMAPSTTPEHMEAHTPSSRQRLRSCRPVALAVVVAAAAAELDHGLSSAWSGASSGDSTHTRGETGRPRGSNAAAHRSMSSLRLAQVAQAPPVAADERQRSPQATATARRLLLGANLQICAQHHAGPSDMSTHLNSEQARSGAAHRRDMLVHTQAAYFPAAGMPHAASK